MKFIVGKQYKHIDGPKSYTCCGHDLISRAIMCDKDNIPFSVIQPELWSIYRDPVVIYGVKSNERIIDSFSSRKYAEQWMKTRAEWDNIPMEIVEFQEVKDE